MFAKPGRGLSITAAPTPRLGVPSHPHRPDLQTAHIPKIPLLHDVHPDMYQTVANLQYRAIGLG